MIYLIPQRPKCLLPRRSHYGTCRNQVCLSWSSAVEPATYQPIKKKEKKKKKGKGHHNSQSENSTIVSG